MAMMVASAASAQFSAGIKSDVRFNSIQLNGITEPLAPFQSPLIAPSIGFFGEYRFDDNITLRSGVNYAKQGLRFSESSSFNLFDIDFPIGVTTDLVMNTLAIPVTAHMSFGDNRVKPYIMAGGGVSRTLSTSLNPRINSIVDFNLPSVDIPVSSINSTQVYGLGGAGISYEMNGGKLFGEVTYQHSFESIKPDFLIDLDLKNKGFSVGIGYAKSF